MGTALNEIRLYTDSDMIQNNPKYVLDNEAFFGRYDTVWDEFSKSIINIIDGGMFCDEFTFYDRYNVRLYNAYLSTGTKTLLNIYSYPEHVFDFRECGDNCIELFLKRMVGAIYVPNLEDNQVYYLSGRNDCRIFLNNLECVDFMEVVEKL